MSIRGHEHGDCQWCAGYEAAVRDLIERGDKAISELGGVEDRQVSDLHKMRVHGKAQGVSLMLSYAREMVQP